MLRLAPEYRRADSKGLFDELALLPTTTPLFVLLNLI